jgi:hypothetical protein
LLHWHNLSEVQEDIKGTAYTGETLPVMSSKDFMAHLNERRRVDPKGLRRETHEYWVKMARRMIDLETAAGHRLPVEARDAAAELMVKRGLNPKVSLGFEFRLPPMVAVLRSRMLAVAAIGRLRPWRRAHAPVRRTVRRRRRSSNARAPGRSTDDGPLPLARRHLGARSLAGVA